MHLAIPFLIGLTTAMAVGLQARYFIAPSAIEMTALLLCGFTSLRRNEE